MQYPSGLVPSFTSVVTHRRVANTGINAEDNSSFLRTEDGEIIEIEG